MRLVVLVLLALLAACKPTADGEGIELLVTVPAHTPANATLSLGGDFNGWNPSDSDFRLNQVAQRQYRLQLPAFPEGHVLNFKVTRGSWDSVEIQANGANRENRNFLVTAELKQIVISVEEWADLSTKEAPSTIVGHVETFELDAPTHGGKRNVRVFLPAGYKQGSQSYPVIYMSDAQNLYDDRTANSGEWQMDELMSKLEQQGSALTSIVVGIDHAGDNRRMEYLPFAYDGFSYRIANGGKPVQGQGDKFADWLVGTLKPLIDTKYRTKPQREFTTIMGSSMGGLISCYTALKHQEVFSKAGCLSSAFLKRLVDEHLIDYIKSTSKRLPTRFHIDMGDNEFGLFGDDILDETQEVHDALIQIGFEKDEVRYQVIKGGTHDEPSWRKRTLDIITWLNQTN